MGYLEMKGATLLGLLHKDEYPPEDLRKAGVTEDSRVRINAFADLEVYQHGEWNVIGGLLGDIFERIWERYGIKWVREADPTE